MSNVKDLIEERGFTATLTEMIQIVEVDAKKLNLDEESERLLVVAIDGELAPLRKVVRKNNFDFLRTKISGRNV